MDRHSRVPFGARFCRLATAGLLAVALWLPTAVSPADVLAADVPAAVPAAATCTGWTDTVVPPSTIRVLRHATNAVQTVDFKTYVKVVMAAEWPQSWPIESLRAGAVTIKQYAWYYAMHYRGGTVAAGCYDVSDSNADQVYSPETRALAAVDVQAVESTWTESIIKNGSFIVTGYRSGNDGPCGADKDGAHLWQHTARTCASDGMPGETILHVYFDPMVLQGGPTAPGQPTGVSAVGFDQSAQVSWLAPASTGGPVIKSYTATSAPDGKTCSTTGALTCAIAGLTNNTAYTFTVTATNWVGTGLPSDPSSPVTPAVVPGATYHPMTPPVRLLDTRVANGLSGRFSANTPRTFTIAGLGVIDAHATAVTGNLTVTGDSHSGAIYLGPDAAAKPSTSTLNFAWGEVTANGVTVALSPTGTLSATYMAASGNTTHMVFDVTGFFTPDTSGATYHPLTPARLLDTRIGNGLSGKFSANSPRSFAVWLRGHVPDTATAVTGNVTVTGSNHSGALYLGPTQIVKPSTSTINFKKGQNLANNVTVALSSTGKLSATFLATYGTTDLVFDVTGYYTAGLSGSKYVPVTPARLLDTRVANGLTGKLAANAPRPFTITGRQCIPPDAVAVSANVTVVNETSGSAIFVGPDRIVKPPTSTLNFVKGNIKANGLTVALGPSGSLSATYLSASGNTTDLVLDVTGYFEGPGLG